MARTTDTRANIRAAIRRVLARQDTANALVGIDGALQNLDKNNIAISGYNFSGDSVLSNYLKNALLKRAGELLNDIKEIT